MKRFIVFVILLGLIAAPASAEQGQSSTRKSSKGRVIGTVVGAAGGFVLGIFAGLSWFDDAINSDQKVWMTAIGVGAVGGVGGYVIGRAASHKSFSPPLRAESDTTLVALPRITLTRRSIHGEQTPSRAANMRIAADLTGADDGIIDTWPRPPDENSSRHSLPQHLR